MQPLKPKLRSELVTRSRQCRPRPRVESNRIASIPNSKNPHIDSDWLPPHEAINAAARTAAPLRPRSARHGSGEHYIEGGAGRACDEVG